jgi:hypothetical protein
MKTLAIIAQKRGSGKTTRSNSDEDIGALRDELFRCGKADPAVTRSDNSYLSFKFFRSLLFLRVLPARAPLD